MQVQFLPGAPKHMSTFLSIDLDFFNSFQDMSGEVSRCLADVQKFAFQRNIPISAVMNHQQMLKFVNNSGCDRLINIDTHSDLTFPDSLELNCGTWVSYVRWRKNGSYVWWHADSVEHGECSGDYSSPVFREEFTKADGTDWKAACHVKSHRLPAIATLNVSAISVCLSPWYVDHTKVIHKIFLAWVRQHKIQYIKGRWNEEFGRHLRPPNWREYYENV